MASIQAVDLVIDSLAMIVFFVALYKIFTLTKKIYGGRFSSLIPQLSAGTSLLLLNSIFEGAAQPIFPIFQDIPAFQAGLDAIQITAGIFFLSVFYQLYHIRFATSGFFGEAAVDDSTGQEKAEAAKAEAPKIKAGKRKR